jgi:hypothetical protein
MQESAKASGVHAAISEAMSEVKPLAKQDRNAHGGYNFAGIDAFLDLTRPICAKHGLSILQDEEGFEVFEVPGKNGPQKMLLMRFAFTVAKDGETVGPMRRSIMVPAAMGSQAFGSGQSYALKQFLRSLFQISTGEKDDIDHHDTGELPEYAPTLVSHSDCALIVQYCKALGGNTQKALLDAYKIEKLPDLTQAQASAAILRLEDKVADAAKAETNAKAQANG